MGPIDSSHHGDASTQETGPLVRAADAERVLSAVMKGAFAPGTAEKRIRGVFADVRPVFGSDTEFHVYLATHLDRDPAPLLLDRIWYGEVYEEIEPRNTRQVQAQIDQYGASVRQRVALARRSRNTPITRTMDAVFGDDIDTLTRRVFEPLGFRHVLISDWISSDDRFLVLHILRKRTEPFSAVEHCLCSMVMHGIAPIVDMHAASRAPTMLSRLSPPQLRTLRAVLSGARVSDEQALKRTLDFIGVPTCEALVAQFVSPAALEEIDELQRIYELEERDPFS